MSHYYTLLLHSKLTVKICLCIGKVGRGELEWFCGENDRVGELKLLVNNLVLSLVCDCPLQTLKNSEGKMVVVENRRTKTQTKNAIENYVERNCFVTRLCL